MENSTSQKISKTKAIQLIDGQIDQFSLLLSPGSSVASPGEKFPSFFRQTVILINELISKDEALNFIKIVASHFISEDSTEESFIDDLYNIVKDLFVETYDEEKLKGCFHKSFDKSSSNDTPGFVEKAAKAAPFVMTTFPGTFLIGLGMVEMVMSYQLHRLRAYPETSLEPLSRPNSGQKRGFRISSK